MSAMPMQSVFVSPSVVESAMEWEEGRLTTVSWLLIQEMAKGVRIEVVAEGMGVGLEDMIALVEHVTQEEGEKALGAWGNAVVALRAAIVSNANQVSYGWDSIEAIAVEKLGRSLSEMKSNGDPLKMLTIAEKANKAIRRGRGEGNSHSTTIQVGGSDRGGVDVELKSGHLGTVMRLSLSPRIQAQLGDPSRVIDSVANKATSGQLPLSMLGLKETRELASQPAGSSLDDASPTEQFDISFLDGVDLG